jgi:uncharacterized protein (DUF2141 family)
VELAVTALPASSSPQATTVQVTIAGLRNSDGLVQACLTAQPRHFPDCSDDHASHKQSVHAQAGLVLDFDDVQPGTYAIALLHDENGNGRADRVLMVPREGFGFSRDAPVRMGPPGFEQAAFAVGDTPVRQTIRMRYMF